MAIPTRWRFAFVAAVIVCAALWWISARSSDGAAPRAAEAASDVPDESNAALAEPQPLDDRPERVALATADAVALQPAPPPAAKLLVRGRVLDLDRRPVAGLEIGRFDRAERTGIRSAADGTFELTLDERGSALEARGPGWATVWADRHDAEDSADVVTILVAPAGRLAGVVVDPGGQPVARAHVATKFARDALRGLSDVLRLDPRDFEYTATSDEQGRFELGDVPLVPGTIVAARVVWKSAPVDIPSYASGDLLLRLKGSVGSAVVVRGRVLDAQGSPAEGAFVALARVMARSDSDGNFALKLYPDERPDLTYELVAVRPGALPVRVPLGDRANLERAASRPFELVLGGMPLAIRGRVVDTDGLPVAGAAISLLEEEFLGALPDEHGDSGMRLTIGKTVEQILRGEGDDWFGSHRFAFSPPTTAQDGSFTIGGLMDREYGLRAEAKSGTIRRDVRSVAAGTNDLRIELDLHVPTQLVRGHVVDGAGQGVAGAEVSVSVLLPGERTPLSLPRVRSGSDGAFRFDDVPGTIVQIGAAFETHEREMHPEPGARLDDVRIALQPMRALQVDASSNQPPTSFEVQDRNGVAILLHVKTSMVSRDGGHGGGSSARRRPIVGGRSDVVSVLGDELTAVLYRGELEVGRVPIVFAREGLTVVRP